MLDDDDKRYQPGRNRAGVISVLVQIYMGTPIGVRVRAIAGPK